MNADNLLEKVKHNIASHGLIRENMRIVVGVSGGPDSMALMDILHKLYPGKVVCAHVEHGLRGVESLADAELVEQACKKRGIEFYIKHINAQSIARARKLSVEEAAREERYAFFNQVMDEVSAGRVAVAHHLDDQAETLLLNLIRGAGPKGLAAMDWIREDGVIRPLLNIEKSELVRYCEQENIKFGQDSTNETSDYSRNLIRNEIIPLVERINPSFARAALRTAQILRQDDEYLSFLADKAREGLVTADEKELRIALKALDADVAVATRVIRNSLEDWGRIRDFEQKHISAAIELARRGESGASLDLPNGLKMRVSYGEMIFHYPAEAFEAQYPFSCGEFYSPAGTVRVSQASANIIGDKDKEYLDADKIPKNAVIRTRKPDDWITPLGMKGTKMLNDYLSDKKMDKMLRDQILVLAYGDEVYWVQKAGISDKVKITPQTQRVIDIEFGGK
ncbi:MAG TPA: tRNA lysidine(34) synthetase TilS [Clostridia bacterium]|nr:tRNA lysidine(34) synthetase TilS [Clostridia bacterium]